MIVAIATCLQIVFPFLQRWAMENNSKMTYGRRKIRLLSIFSLSLSLPCSIRMDRHLAR